MDVRRYTINIFHPGGNASKDAKAYKLSIPSKWAQEMGFTKDDRVVKLTYEDGKIVVEKD